MKLLSRFIFWLFGWKIAGEVPTLKKYVAIMAPHTSAWDFPIAMLAKFILGIQFSFLGKEEVFRPPFGFIFRALGGVPVDRSSSHQVVDHAVHIFQQRDHFILALSPEGTRAYAPHWKTGFYHIAQQAGIPIVLGYIDYQNKIVGIGPTFYPTGDIDKDIETIKTFYRPIQGRHPELGVH